MVNLYLTKTIFALSQRSCQNESIHFQQSLYISSGAGYGVRSRDHDVINCQFGRFLGKRTRLLFNIYRY